MLKTIGPEDFDVVYAIMEEAFPVSERRPYHGQRKLLKEEAYTLYGLVGAGALHLYRAFCRFPGFPEPGYGGNHPWGNVQGSAQAIDFRGGGAR
ncbi:MAG: hypothetical protein ACRC2P_10995, partial [Eubacterium aggregans]